MEQKKDLSIINCVATSLLAIFFTIPLHEFIHLLTHIIYGNKIVCYSAQAVEADVLIDYSSLSAFSRIMVTGGSASILNALIGIVLLFVLLKIEMGAMTRLFLTHLMGMQLCEGFGYFMSDGLFGAGDWGVVFSYFPDDPGFVSILKIVLTVVGMGGIVMVMFVLNYMSYYFVEDPTNKKERINVAAKLHLSVLVIGLIVHFAGWMQSPYFKSGEIGMAVIISGTFMWVPYLWGFLFTGVMGVMRPKESRFLYKLPEKPNYILLGIGIILILVDIFVFGPGINFN